ncbi:MAG: hypothetical protein ACPGJS_04445 [Flammeovirgaceae bacterium]
MDNKITASNIDMWMNVHINTLPISRRAYQILRLMEIETLADLEQYDSDDFERFSITSNSINEVMKLMVLANQALSTQHV